MPYLAGDCLHKNSIMNTHKESSLVEIFSGDIIEAGMVKSLLEDSGIHAYLKDEIMGTLGPWWTTPGGAGSVRVIVAGSDAEGARLIVEEYERNIKNP